MSEIPPGGILLSTDLLAEDFCGEDSVGVLSLSFDGDSFSQLACLLSSDSATRLSTTEVPSIAPICIVLLSFTAGFDLFSERMILCDCFPSLLDSVGDEDDEQGWSCCIL